MNLKWRLRLPQFVQARRERKLEALEAAEARMLASVKVPLSKQLVPINSPNSRRLNNRQTLVINTVSTGTTTTSSSAVTSSFPCKPHLLLVHGWAGGVGIWINNFEFLSQHYTVHAIDLLGWGLSSRPKLTLPLVANNSTTSTSSPSFSSSESHASHAQEWWVSSIEQWRKRMGIDKFTLVGHSMGGFIAASYAMKHGSQLDKLVLLSPIGLNGFSVPPPTTHRTRLRNFVINSIWNITPQRLISFMSADRVRQMILRSRNHVAKSFQTDGDTVVEYVFLLATTGRVTGATAFTKLMSPTRGWMLPLRTDMHKLKEYGFPVLVVYGARDWIDAAWAVREIGQNRMLGDNGKVYLIDSGHHGYVEAAAQFNDIIVHGDSPGKCGSSPVTSLKQLEEIRGPRLSSFSIS